MMACRAACGFALAVALSHAPTGAAVASGSLRGGEAARQTARLAAVDSAALEAARESAGKNPVRKVVQLLESMAKNVAAEGEKEEALYKKFSCYCNTGEADLKESIAGSDAKVPALQSDIESSESAAAKLKEDLKQHQVDRTAAEKAMSEATALREKEHASFVSESATLKEYVDALAKAVLLITSGMAGTGLLQASSTAAALLRKAAAGDAQLTDDDRASVVSFLSGGSTSEYIPASGEILGILKTMQEDFEKDLAGVTATEEEAQKLFEDLVAAKTKEVKSLGESIERKTARAGELAVQVVHMKNDLTETEAMLIADQKFLQELAGSCESKKTEWDERQKVRAEELVAIHETIKILNDDDALDLFKKTLAPASFVQLSAMSRAHEQARQRARALLLAAGKPALGRAAAADRPEVRFLALALQGGKVDFSKVVKMIDDMVALLAQEQTDDDGKREYCNTQIDSVEDKAKELAKGLSDAEMAIEDSTEAIATMEEEIKTLQAGIAELDKLVAEATEQRKKENEEFTQLMSENTEAKELLAYAKNRLSKFYNPAPAKAEAPEKEEAASFLQDPGAEPETWKEYKTKGQESGSVISMIDLLIRDLTKEMTVAETDEEHSQKEYEELMQDSASKRAKAMKSVSIKESTKADSEVVKSSHEGDRKEVSAELSATKTYELQLHAECDWLVQNYDLRKTARADEADSLKSAKAILKGADFSFTQVDGGTPAASASRRF